MTDAAQEQAVLVERRDRIMIITLNRPEAMNAINGALSHGLLNAVRDASKHWPEGTVHFELFGSTRSAATVIHHDGVLANPLQVERWTEDRYVAVALLDDWFLGQGGRGAQPSCGSRSRNALVTAAGIAILGELYGERFQTLVLASQPERLGEWRRGLQDCLGLAREDFGPTSGIVLFERADALVERADRLEERGELPFIVVDAGEPVIEIPILQFPLWLVFAAGPGELMADETY